MSHTIMEDHNNVNIWTWYGPQPILTASSRNYSNLSIQHTRVIWLLTAIKSFFNPFNNLVSLLKINPSWYLFMINLVNESFSFKYSALSLLWVKAIQSEHHMRSSHLFIAFYLFSLNALFVNLKVRVLYDNLRWHIVNWIDIINNIIVVVVHP